MQHLAVAPIPYSSLTLDQLYIVLFEKYAIRKAIGNGWSFRMTMKELRKWNKEVVKYDETTLSEKRREATREISVSWLVVIGRRFGKKL
jgi:hypothetical protein